MHRIAEIAQRLLQSPIANAEHFAILQPHVVCAMKSPFHVQAANPNAFALMRAYRRVLEPEGLLLWVDAPYLYSPDLWSRMMNAAYSVTGVCAKLGIESAWQALRNVDNGM